MKTLLIDGKYFLYRSINAKVILTYKEQSTSMYYLLLNAIKSVTKKTKNNNSIIMWDSNHSYRRDYYPEYKVKKNKTTDPILIEQFENIKKEYKKIKDRFNSLGFASYTRHGLEADDLIALYCEQYPKEEITITTRDEDLYVLLRHPNVKIYDPHEKIFKTATWFTQTYNIEPHFWEQYKTIGGCSSDGVPGIPGFGPKTTLKWIQGEISVKNKIRLIDSQNIVIRNKQLVTLPFMHKTLKPKQTRLNMDVFSTLCQLMGFRSFLENLDEWQTLFQGYYE